MSAFLPLWLEATNAIGRALLSFAAALLFEELTIGGLVRLILAPRPRPAKQQERTHNDSGDSKCSH